MQICEPLSRDWKHGRDVVLYPQWYIQIILKTCLQRKLMDSSRRKGYAISCLKCYCVFLCYFAFSYGDFRWLMLAIIRMIRFYNFKTNVSLSLKKQWIVHARKVFAKLQFSTMQIWNDCSLEMKLTTNLIINLLKL